MLLFWPHFTKLVAWAMNFVFELHGHPIYEFVFSPSCVEVGISPSCVGVGMGNLKKFIIVLHEYLC